MPTADAKTFWKVVCYCPQVFDKALTLGNILNGWDVAVTMTKQGLCDFYDNKTRDPSSAIRILSKNLHFNSLPTSTAEAVVNICLPKFLVEMADESMVFETTFKTVLSEDAPGADNAPVATGMPLNEQAHNRQWASFIDSGTVAPHQIKAANLKVRYLCVNCFVY